MGSLSDLLERPLTAEPARIGLAGSGAKSESGLFAAELDPAALLSGFVEAHRAVVEQVVRKGAVLNRDELATVLAQAVPGLDELAVLLRLAELLESKSVDRVVIDGPSTSQTPRLLDLAQTLRRFLSLVKLKGDKSEKSEKSERSRRGEGKKSEDARDARSCQ